MDNAPPAGDDGFTIDDEFKNLLPSLNSEDFDQLEKSILKDGCRDALIVWAEERVLIDGHHRHAICKKHNRPFGIDEKSFADRDEVMDWMIENQKTRRNMNKFLWAETVLKRKDHIAAQAKKNQRAGVRLESNERVDTLQALADIAGITRDAMYKVKVILAIAAADPTDTSLNAQIDALRNGDDGFTISGVYDELLKIKSNKASRAKSKQRNNKSTAPQNSIPTESPQDLAGQIDRITAAIESIAEECSIEDQVALYNTLDKWLSKKKSELILSEL
jgi:hypothetical protein